MPRVLGSATAAFAACCIACGPRVDNSSGPNGDGSADASSADAMTMPRPDLDTLPVCTDQEVQGCTDGTECVVERVREVLPGPDEPCAELVESEVCASRAEICEFIHVSYRHLPSGRCFLFRSDCRPDPSLWGNDDACPRRGDFPDCE